MGSDRILIVEDDQMLVSMFSDALGAVGYDVTAQDSIFGAAARVRELQPAAVLLDLGLPFRSGTSLLAELKADPRTTDVPVLVVSGMPETLAPDRRALAAAVLSKPFGLDDLLNAVRCACAGERQN